MTSTIKDGLSYIERTTLCTTNIGADDIILGDPSLKSHEGRYGPLETNTWRMGKNGISYLIPLMTAGDNHTKVIETFKDTKKNKKLIHGGTYAAGMKTTTVSFSNSHVGRERQREKNEREREKRV
jgi:hypothetical protein